MAAASDRRRLFSALAATLLILPLSSSSSVAAAAKEHSYGVCVSPGGRFPRFSLEGKSPRRAPKGPKDLTLCRVFRQRTCCDVAQTYPALISVRRLASSGEGSQECLHLWELLECSICDPQVGIRPGPPRICSSFCDMVFEACSSAYFVLDMKTQVLSPCGLSDILCGRANEWASNGTELCRLAGFSVHLSSTLPDGDDSFCYGGKASLDSVADSWKASQTDTSSRSETSGVAEDFQQWLHDMSINEKVSWTVGGMVLTAGLIFISKRKSSRRGRQIGGSRTGQRLEAQQRSRR